MCPLDLPEEFLDVDVGVDASACVGVDDDEALALGKEHSKQAIEELELLCCYWHFRVVSIEYLSSWELLALKNYSHHPTTKMMIGMKRSVLLMAHQFRFDPRICYPIHASASPFDQLMGDK